MVNTVGIKQEDGSITVYKPVVMKFIPGIVTWVGNQNLIKERIEHVIPLFQTEDSSTIGDLLLRDLVNDLRTGLDDPGVFEGPVVPSIYQLTAETDQKEKAKVLRAKMLLLAFLDRQIDSKHLVQLLEYVTHVLKANSPDVALKITQSGLKVYYNTHPLIKTDDFLEMVKTPFGSAEDLANFLGNLYCALKGRLDSHCPGLQVPVISEDIAA